MENQAIEMKKILKDCIKYGKTIGVATPTAIEICLKARKGEIFEEKEKIKKARLKIKKIEAIKILIEKVLTNFWIKEMDKRRKK